MPGTDAINQIVTGGLTMSAAWSLLIIMIVFMLAWTFKGFALDVLGRIWFQMSPFEKGVKILHDTNSGVAASAIIEDATLKTLILAYSRKNGKDFRRYIPMSEVKAVSIGWQIEYPTINEAGGTGKGAVLATAG